MRKLYWRLYIIRLSFYKMFEVNLGDIVWYQDKKYMVMNGAKADKDFNPLWRLSGHDKPFDFWVRQDACIKSRAPMNYVKSFKSMYRFYMTSWYSIWVHSNEIEGWVKNCQIWPEGYWK